MYNVAPGIPIKEIQNENSTYCEYIDTYKRYDPYDYEEDKEKFECLKDNGEIITDVRYENSIWCFMGNNSIRSIDYSSINSKSEIQKALKSFIVALMYDKRISVDSILTSFSILIRFLLASDFFSLKMRPAVELLLNQYSDSTLAEAKYIIIQFILFYPIKDSDNYLEEMLKYTRPKRNTRELPNFQSIVDFNTIIDDFWSANCKIQIDFNELNRLRNKYYPIYIWWRVTPIIPTRPIEFLNFGIDCCSKDDDKFLINIPRCKLKPEPLKKSRKERKSTPLRINQATYEIIDYYSNLTKSIDADSEFLFSQKTYIELTGQSLRCSRKDRINYDILRRLLESFYNEVIAKYYDKVPISREKYEDELDYTIVKLQLGDTRHLAFCSMMLQGYNPLTIAQIGGHEKLESQMHYFSHAEMFVESHSLMLTGYILSHMNREETIYDHFGFNDIKMLAIRWHGHSPCREIEYGRCYDKDFPDNCIETRCLFCDFHEIDMAKLSRYEISEIEKSISEINNEIKVKINLLRKYFISQASSKIQEDESNRINREREKEARLMSINIGKKAILQAYSKAYFDMKAQNIAEAI